MLSLNAFYVKEACVGFGWISKHRSERHITSCVVPGNLLFQLLLIGLRIAFEDRRAVREGVSVLLLFSATQ